MGRLKMTRRWKLRGSCRIVERWDELGGGSGENLDTKGGDEEGERRKNEE